MIRSAHIPALAPALALALLALSGWLGTAAAQPTREQLAARCNELGALYDRYNTRRSEGSGGPDMARLGAGIDCQKGRYEDGIRTLEELLRRSRIAIPPGPA